MSYNVQSGQRELNQWAQSRKESNSTPRQATSDDGDYSDIRELGWTGGEVKSWNFAIRKQNYCIRLHHGGITGKRRVFVNGEKVSSKNTKFRLVGYEKFVIDHGIPIVIKIEPVKFLRFRYSLQVNGQSLASFQKTVSNIAETRA